MDNIVLVAETMHDAVKIDITRSNRELGYKQNQIAVESDLYVKSLRQLEETMREEQKQIEEIIPTLIREKV